MSCIDLGWAAVTDVKLSCAEVHAEHARFSVVVVVVRPEVVVEETAKQRCFADTVVTAQYHLHTCDVGSVVTRVLTRVLLL